MSTKRWAKDHLNENHYTAFFADVDAVGWDEALKRLLARDDLARPEKIRQFLEDRKRNDFLYVLPIHENSVVLDYGCGWGNTTFTVAPLCKHVYAIDVDAQRLRFAGEHFKARNLTNVTTINGGNSSNLPIPSGSIDVVIMNGVLEWTPVNEAGTPPEVHQRVLGEIFRVLKPGGTLHVSIENRNGYEYYLGRKDHHSGGLRFVTFLPRPLADLWSRIHLKRAYRTWFYSYGALRDTVSKAGFENSKIYTYFPNHVRYSHLFQVDHPKAVQQVITHILATQRMRRSIRMIFQLSKRFPGIFKYIAQDYMLVTTKAAG